MSSTIARVNKKTFITLGTLGPKSETTPIANAISVAIGIPHPSDASPDELKAKNITAGTTIPPIAAINGNKASRNFFKCPVTISRLISRPTTKKKRTINTSFTN